MYKTILLFILTILVISCAGSNATTMEYRSATTAVRSERDLTKGEKYALKALDMDEHANDARVAYFLATEIYRPKNNWVEMNRMLDIVLRRNDGYKKINQKDQPIDKILVLDDGETIIRTFVDAVPVYKEEIWRNIFNQAVDLVQIGNHKEALEKITFAKTVLENVDNFITSSLLYIEINDIDKAKKDLNSALKINPNNARALQIYGDLELQESNLTSAMNYYKKAITNTKDPDALNELDRGLIGIYVELEDYAEAINLSEQLLEKNLDDPNVFYNVGVIYQRLASTSYDTGFEGYNISNASENIDETTIQSAYSDFKRSYEMTQKALNYFIESSLTEESENSSTDSAISDMRRLRKNLKEIYIPSIEKIAADHNIELN